MKVAWNVICFKVLKKPKIWLTMRTKKKETVKRKVSLAPSDLHGFSKQLKLKAYEKYMSLMRKDLKNRKSKQNSSIMTREEIKEFITSTEAYVILTKEESRLGEIEDEEEKKKCKERISKFKREHEELAPSGEMMSKLNYLRNPYENGELVRIRKDFRSLYQNDFSKTLEHDHICHVYSVEDAFEIFVQKFQAYEKKPSKPARVLNDDLKEYAGITTKMCEHFLTACLFVINEGVGKKKVVDIVPQTETPKKGNESENLTDTSSSVRNPFSDDDSKGEEDVEEDEGMEEVEVETSNMDETTKEVGKDKSEKSPKGGQKSSEHMDDTSTSVGLNKSGQSSQVLKAIPKKSSKVSRDDNVISATNDSKGNEKKSDESSTRRESLSKKNASSDKSGMNEGGNNAGLIDKKQKTDLQKAFEQFSKDNSASLSRMTCHHIMLNVFNHKFTKLRQFRESQYFVLGVYDLVTGYCFFRHMEKPYDRDEVSLQLSTIFGDFGYPSTVTYYDRGISFFRSSYEINGNNIEKKIDICKSNYSMRDLMDVSTES